MRHGKKINHLGRTDAHRKAMLANMATSLIVHKRINTTVAKAKALRKYVEPLITKAKNDTTHSRRVVFSYLQDKKSVAELFRDVAEKVSDRPGGYTRIIKVGTRFGDNAEMCFIELVDYNDVYSQSGAAGAGEKSKTTRRSRSKTKKTAEPKAEEAVVEEAVVVETAEEKETIVADDLTKVEGIGPKIAEVLTTAGITSFAALVEKSAEEVSAILAENDLSSHSPDTWAKQAELAAAGKWDELKTLQDELQGGREEEK